MKIAFQNNRSWCSKLALLGVVLLPGVACAQYFTASKGDLLAGFRKPGVGSYELVVKVGNITNLLAMPPGATVPINHLSPSQLSDAFSGFGDLQWSVSASYYLGRPNSQWAGFALDTLWYTVPRDNPSSRTSPPTRRSNSSQASAAAKITSIGNGAANLSQGMTTTNADNNLHLVREPIGNANDYSVFVKDLNNPLVANFGGSMPFSVEKTTPASFTSAVVSDLYQSVPTGYRDPNTDTNNGAAYYVGHFTLTPDGALTFTRASGVVPLPPAPKILSVTRANDTTTIYFTTTNGPTYTLYYSTSAGLGAPLSSWSASPTTVVGNGLTKSLSDTTTAAMRFYRIEVH